MSKIVFQVKNDTGLHLDFVHLEIEEWNEAGWLEASSNVTLRTELAAGEERLFTQPVQNVPGASGVSYVLRRGEAWGGHVTSMPGPPDHVLSRKFAISTCTRYCERCSDKAGERCLGGVKDVNCSCTDDMATCNFSCYPPPE